MRDTINCNGESAQEAIEAHHVAVDSLLPAVFSAEQLTVLQSGPEKSSCGEAAFRRKVDRDAADPWEVKTLPGKTIPHRVDR